MMVENVIGPSTTWFTSGGDVGEQWLSERVIIWAVRKKDGKMKRMRELTHDARIRSSAYRDR